MENLAGKSGYSRKRRRPPKHFKLNQNAWFMRSLHERSKRACAENHPVLRRIWRKRDAWLAKAVKGIPPGAVTMQKTGRPLPPFWTSGKGLAPQYSTKRFGCCYIYAIVNVKTGRIYVGRTVRSPYKRVLEHVQSEDFIGRAVRSQHENFVVTLEKLPAMVPGVVLGVKNLMQMRRRENSWIHRLDARRNGYNSRVEIRPPPRPSLPSHGFHVRPIRTSRHPTRISNRPAFKSAASRKYLSRDWKRRWTYIISLDKISGAAVQLYVDKLKPKTVRCMLKYISQEAFSREQFHPFKRLRAKYLDQFPSPEMPTKKRPKLLILGYTSKLADVISLRGILMRPNLLSLIPPEARKVRDVIHQTVPGFKYGDVTDRMFLNGTRVGRDLERKSTCICTDPHWKKYAMKIFDGTSCVVTTEMSVEQECSGSFGLTSGISI